MFAKKKKRIHEQNVSLECCTDRNRDVVFLRRDQTGIPALHRSLCSQTSASAMMWLF